MTIPKFPPAAHGAPEEVRVLLGAHAHELALRRDDVGLAHPPPGIEPVLAPEPPEAAAHRVANDADAGAGSLEPREPVRLRLGDDVPPQRARLDARGARLGVDEYASHAGGVHEHAAVAGGADAVPRRHYPDAETPLPGEAHGGDYIRDPLRHDHNRGARLDAQVPRPTRLVVALVARHVRSTLKAGPQRL